VDIYLVVLAVMLALSGFFSGSETALFSVSMLHVKKLVKKKKKNAKALLDLKSDPQKLIITILIGNNLVNIGASALATVLAVDYFGSYGAGIATGGMTFFVLIFGEIVPKNYAVQNAEKISLIIAKPILILSYVFAPLVWFFSVISKSVMTILGSDYQEGLFSEDDLRIMLESGVEENKLLGYERKFIHGVLNFNDLTAKDVLTPRMNMFCLDWDMKIQEGLKEINRREFSRIPIYKGDKDKIKGIIHVKDFLRLTKAQYRRKLRSVSREVVFIHKEMPLNEILALFMKKQVHIAVVQDEYGGTLGLVTIEDLIEEITGDILDESDVSPKLIKRISKNKILVHGNTLMDDINDFFNTNLSPKDSHITVAHYFGKKYKKKIAVGSNVALKRVSMTVRELDGAHPIRIILKKNTNK